jgi:hypothetical protein
MPAHPRAFGVMRLPPLRLGPMSWDRIDHQGSIDGLRRTVVPLDSQVSARPLLLHHGRSHRGSIPYWLRRREPVKYPVHPRQPVMPGHRHLSRGVGATPRGIVLPLDERARRQLDGTPRDAPRNRRPVACSHCQFSPAAPTSWRYGSASEPRRHHTARGGIRIGTTDGFGRIYLDGRRPTGSRERFHNRA